MHPFEYVAPATVDDALGLLARHRGAAKVLAGGQSLVPVLAYRLARPEVVVDINALPLDGIRVADGSLRLGALTRHAALEEDPEVARWCPVLREAAGLIGNVRVRALGTLGGSLAHADPAGELPMVAVALDARLTLRGPGGERTVPAAGFFTGYLSTGLADDELVTAVEIPVTRGLGHAIEEVTRRAGDFATVAVTALVGVDRRGRVDHVRVALGGVGARPVRASAAEDALRGREPTADWIQQAAAAARAAVEPETDAFASAAYRRHLAGVLARRALGRAVAGALEVA